MSNATIKGLMRPGFLLPALLLALQAVPGVAQAQSGSRAALRGDVDRDGEITAADAFSILSAAIGKTPPAEYRLMPNGDADGNGRISISDVLLVLRYSVGRESKDTPVGQPLLSVSLAADSGSIETGHSTALHATVTGATDTGIIWRSSAPDIAEVDSAGKVQGRAPGTATIFAIAREDTVSQAWIAIGVNPVPVAALTVSPASTVVTNVGETVQLSATAVDDQGRAVPQPLSWTSSDTTLAVVDETGKVTALRPGAATIRASGGGKSASKPVQVRAAAVAALSVSPDSVTLGLGQRVTLSATPTDAAGNALTGLTVGWSSSDPAVASVSALTSMSSSGSVSAVAYGTAVITASSGGKSTSVTVKVQVAAPIAVASVTLSSSSVSLQVGEVDTLTVVTKDASGTVLTGRSVSWFSSDSTVTSVSTAGVVTAMKAGSATITAISEATRDSARVTVTEPQTPSDSTSAQTAPSPASLVIAPASVTLHSLGETATLSATVKDAKGNAVAGCPVSWSSLSPRIVEVDKVGSIVARTVGLALIVAGCGSVTDTVGVSVQQVVASVGVSSSRSSVPVGGTIQLSATAKDASGNPVEGVDLTYLSSNPAVATVSSTGLVIGVGPGTTSITASTSQAHGSVSVSVVSQQSTIPTAPELPRYEVDVSMPATPGKVIRVNAGGDVQAALDAAQPGDVVELQAGVTFHGGFVLPKKTGDGWVVIRSSAYAQLPPQGTRATPADAIHMATLMGGENNKRVLSTAPGAHHYRIVGLEIKLAPDSELAPIHNAIVELGDVSQTADQIPHHLVLDRVYIHASPETNLQRCLVLNSAWSAVIDSRLDECHGRGITSQGITSYNGAGPFRIENNYIAGAGINVAFGGSIPSVKGLSPSDIVIRHNYLVKPMSWQGKWEAKNLLEAKNARRVLIEGNVMENSWVNGQDGIALSFKSPPSQDGGSGSCPWCGAHDITLRYNLIRHAAAGVKLTQEQGTSDIYIHDNLFSDIGDDPALGSNGRLFTIIGNIRNLRIEHNTGFAPVEALLFTGDPQESFSFRDNVVQRGAYGIKGGGAAEGTATLEKYAPGGVVTGNIIIGAAATLYPSGNSFPANELAVGFVNWSGGDYRLSPSSPFLGTASDGIDPGANVTAVLSATQGVAP